MILFHPPSSTGVAYVCDLLGHSPLIFDRTKTPKLTMLVYRKEVYEFLRVVYHWSYPAIAKYTENKSHSTVVESLRTRGVSSLVGAAERRDQLIAKFGPLDRPELADKLHTVHERKPPKPRTTHGRWTPFMGTKNPALIVKPPPPKPLPEPARTEPRECRPTALIEREYLTNEMMAELFGVPLARVDAALRSTGRRPRHGWGHPHAYGRSVVAKIAKILNVKYIAHIAYQSEIVNVAHIYEWALIAPRPISSDKHRIFGRMAG